MLKVLNGNETWTNAFGKRFGERVCILIENDGLVNGGKKFMPTKKEMNRVWKDYCENEGIRDEVYAEIKKGIACLR